VKYFEAARVDLALHLLTRFLPDESVDAVPFLLSGYPMLAGEDPSLEAAIKNLRHYCAEFASSYAWGAALDTHEEVPEINRAYRVEGRRRAVRR
jgi:restriction endonuclease in pPIWI_RE module